MMRSFAWQGLKKEGSDSRISGWALVTNAIIPLCKSRLPATVLGAATILLIQEKIPVRYSAIPSIRS